MTQEKQQKNLKQFLQAVAQDTEIQEKLNSTTDEASYINLFVELGRERGYSFTKAQVEDALNKSTEQAEKASTSVAQLSEQELALVAGGALPSVPNCAGPRGPAVTPVCRPDTYFCTTNHNVCEEPPGLSDAWDDLDAADAAASDSSLASIIASFLLF